MMSWFFSNHNDPSRVNSLDIIVLTTMIYYSLDIAVYSGAFKSRCRVHFEHVTMVGSFIPDDVDGPEIQTESHNAPYSKLPKSIRLDNIFTAKNPAFVERPD